MILGLDPGPLRSGYVLFDEHTQNIAEFGVQENGIMLLNIVNYSQLEDTSCAIEMVASYGMPVGAEVFDTVLWTGRFVQKWNDWGNKPARLVYRKDVKLHLCGQTKGVNDGVIRQRLIDLLGAPGTKKNKGPTYGLNSHMWPALACAITAAET